MSSNEGPFLMVQNSTSLCDLNEKGSENECYVRESVSLINHGWINLYKSWMVWKTFEKKISLRAKRLRLSNFKGAIKPLSKRTFNSEKIEWERNCYVHNMALSLIVSKHRQFLKNMQYAATNQSVFFISELGYSILWRQLERIFEVATVIINKVQSIVFRRTVD